MGHWGVRSYENDDAADALDAGLARVHGPRYEEMMDDRNPLSAEQVQAQLASPATLAAAIEALADERGTDRSTWDDDARPAFAGVVVRHAELGLAIPEEDRRQAIDWLEREEIDWHEATKRRLRRDREITLLRKAAPVTSS